MSYSGTKVPERLAYTVADACVALGCGRTKLYELIGAGQLDARALGGRTLITAESMSRLIASLPPAQIGQKQQAA